MISHLELDALRRKVYASLILLPQGNIQSLAIQLDESLEFMLSGIQVDGVRQPKIKIIGPYELQRNGRIKFDHPGRMTFTNSKDAEGTAAASLKKVDLVAFWVPEIKAVILRPTLFIKRGAILDDNPIYVARYVNAKLDESPTTLFRSLNNATGSRSDEHFAIRLYSESEGSN